eukprot:gene10549-10709_t
MVFATEVNGIEAAQCGLPLALVSGHPATVSPPSLTAPVYSDHFTFAAVSTADGDDQEGQVTAAIPAGACNGVAVDQHVSCHPGAAALQHQQQEAITLANEAAEAAGMVLSLPTVKRSSSSAGMAGHHGNNKKQHRSSASSPASSTSPASAIQEAVAAAASLQQLSSAAGVELPPLLPAGHTPPAREPGCSSPRPPHQHNSTGSGGQDVLQEETPTLASHADAVGARAKSEALPAGRGDRLNPQRIINELVEEGVLSSATPKTHCFVQCGQVQGVFSLDTGSILCLCNDCHKDGGREYSWFAPAAFERHGGMAASKKWRGSIQVKGLPSRKTLGQWLDDRGVTAKPRVTLADQVQQVHVTSPPRSRTHNQVAGAAGQPAFQQQSDLAPAARLGKAVLETAGTAGTQCGQLVGSSCAIKPCTLHVEGQLSNSYRLPATAAMAPGLEGIGCSNAVNGGPAAAGAGGNPASGVKSYACNAMTPVHDSELGLGGSKWPQDHVAAGSNLARLDMRAQQQQPSGASAAEDDTLKLLAQLLPKLIACRGADVTGGLDNWQPDVGPPAAPAAAARSNGQHNEQLELRDPLNTTDVACGASDHRTLTEAVALAAASAADQPVLATELLQEALLVQLRTQQELGGSSATIPVSLTSTVKCWIVTIQAYVCRVIGVGVVAAVVTASCKAGEN